MDYMSFLETATSPFDAIATSFDRGVLIQSIGGDLILNSPVVDITMNDINVNGADSANCNRFHDNPRRNMPSRK